MPGAHQQKQFPTKSSSRPSADDAIPHGVAFLHCRTKLQPVVCDRVSITCTPANLPSMWPHRNSQQQESECGLHDSDGSNPADERAFEGSHNLMKETGHTATKKSAENSQRSHLVSPAKRKKNSSTSVHREGKKRASASGPENRAPERRSHAAGTEKRSHKRRIHVVEVQDWVPEQPVHVGGIKNPPPEPPAHFAGVENRSHAAHLNDIHAEAHPKPVALPVHGLFPRKQP